MGRRRRRVVEKGVGCLEAGFVAVGRVNTAVAVVVVGCWLVVGGNLVPPQTVSHDP